MKNINPLFLLFASLSIFFIAFFNYNENIKQKRFANEDFETFKKLSSQYIQYKNQYIDRKKIIQSLETILKKEKVSNGKLETKKDKIIVTVDKITIVKLDRVVNKILNQKLNINKIVIEKSKLFIEIGVL